MMLMAIRVWSAVNNRNVLTHLTFLWTTYAAEPARSYPRIGLSARKWQWVGSSGETQNLAVMHDGRNLHLCYILISIHSFLFFFLSFSFFLLIHVAAIEETFTEFWLKCLMKLGSEKLLGFIFLFAANLLTLQFRLDENTMI